MPAFVTALGWLALSGAFAGAAATTKILNDSDKGKAVAGRTKGRTAAERQAVSESNKQLAAQAGIEQKGGRPRPPDAPIVGQAVIRGSDLLGDTEEPPDTAKLASSNLVSAYAAGERARKRAASGATMLTAGQTGRPGPSGAYAQKTLLGS